MFFPQATLPYNMCYNINPNQHLLLQTFSGAVIRTSSSSAAMLPQVKGAGQCSSNFVCVVLAMLVTMSLQIESQWGVEYPVVPWEDMWQEMEMMAKGKNCPTEISTCWHTANATSQPLVPELCRWAFRWPTVGTARPAERYLWGGDLIATPLELCDWLWHNPCCLLHFYKW